VLVTIFQYYGPVILEYFFVFVIPLYSINLITEKEKGLRSQLALNSLSPLAYWLGTFIGDVSFPHKHTRTHACMHAHD
jgi:hypothetical protein